MTETQTRLDELDRRIVGALQVDGRASWHRIAKTLGESNRTVARRGARLLTEGVVRVTGLAARGDAVLVRAHCAPGATRMAATNLAHRPETTFTYTVTGSSECVAEVIWPSRRLATLVHDELPSIPGVSASSSHPVLRYFRTVHEWQPGLIQPDEQAALTEYPPITPPASEEDPEPVSREDAAMLRALHEDGRRSYDELGRAAGISEPTARRRVDALRRQGRLLIRAVVEPADIGLPVEALLWVRVPPTRIEEVGTALLTSPLVRYAAAVMGEDQLVVDVTLPDEPALYDFVTDQAWVQQVSHVDSSLVVEAFKRSGVLATWLV